MLRQKQKPLQFKKLKGLCNYSARKFKNNITFYIIKTLFSIVAAEQGPAYQKRLRYFLLSLNLSRAGRYNKHRFKSRVEPQSKLWKNIPQQAAGY